jgi:hypothetical protein
MKRIPIAVAGAAIVLLGALPTAAAHFGPGGRLDAPLVAGQRIPAGTASTYNTKGEFHVEVVTQDGWLIQEVQIFVGNGTIPVTKAGNALPGKFPYKTYYPVPAASHLLLLDLKNHLGFSWGAAWESQRHQKVAIHADVVKLDSQGKVIASEGAWAYHDLYANPFPGSSWDWWVQYELAHPMRGHFVDSPVAGLGYRTSTAVGLTDQAGAFDYFPDESVAFAAGSIPLGQALGDHRVTPLDLFATGDTDHVGAINVARLLQTLDSDRAPQNGIVIDATGRQCLNTAAAQLGVPPLDFTDSAAVDALISATVANCGGLLAEVSAADAKAHLDDQLASAMFRKNVSKTPLMASAKAKLELMPVLVPATKANEDVIAEGVDYYDEEGNFLYNRELVKPLIAVYADQIPETGKSDVFGAVSRDDGASWKRMNLSRGADLSSFELATGEPYYGDTKKPNLTVKGNYALVAWQSKFCRGGRPRYSLEPFFEDGVTPNPYYVDDIWGVGGPQRSHDYTEDGFPEVGELPYYCLWVARGTVDPVTAEISWRKPERLTSGRRDVWQIAINGANNVGFGVIWQEDPEGVRPGEAAGPGEGWSGATTNHKTDIWYSFVKWSDFAKIDEEFAPNGDPEHSFDDPEWTTNRPMPQVPFSLPMRLSDNDICNTDNMMVELGEDGLPLIGPDGRYIPMLDEEGKHAGTHRYCYEQAGLCEGFYSYVNSQGVTKNVCITADNRLLDGDTGASRPNINFMPYTKKDGTQSAWVAIVYEETKGVGSGAVEWDDDEATTHDDEKDKADLGKNVVYHSFEFAAPEKVSGGSIVNLPARDANGDLLHLVDEYGELILDWQGQPQFAYENARRPRMLVQPAGQAGSANTVMIMVFKQGEDGKGRPSDIFLRRIVNPKDGLNPYAFKNFAPGALNMSSVTPSETWTNPDQDDQANGEGLKIVKFEQTVENLADASWENPYDDARAHRGILRGNNVFLAYDHTPNWAASRNGHDKYDLYLRRSFDGGRTWTTDPFGDEDVCHTNVWKDYDGVLSEADSEKKDTYEETFCYAPGAFEPGRNISQLKNNKESVIEPRLVGPPSTIATSTYPEDVENKDVFYLSFGTEINVPKGDYEEDDGEASQPADLYYTFTQDRGQTFFKRLWEVNPDSDGTYAGQTVERYDFLAKGDPQQSEAQLRMSPDGSKFYAVWNEEGVEGSDTWFRRIMSMAFDQNVGTPLAP